MNTCKTCKWWGASPDWEGYTLDKDGGLACEGPKLRYDNANRKLKPDELCVAQMEYWLAIITGPDFGCIHHEAVTHDMVCKTCGREVTIDDAGYFDATELYCSTQCRDAVIK